MTDNEIIKALNCCVAEDVANCEECPYDEHCATRENRMLNDVLDLINRLKAENESLETELKKYKKLDELAERYIEVTDRLKSQMRSDILEANLNYNHIKELWKYEKEKVEKAKQKVIECCKKLQTAKTDTIQGFVKNVTSKLNCIPQHHFTLEQVLYDIDQTAKEMREDEAK